jgi:hypothetical protein
LIYQISTSDGGQKLGPIVQLPLAEGGTYSSPSVSRDGKWMAYDSNEPGKPDTIFLRNMVTGTDHLLDDKGREPGEGGETSISPDGSRAIFEGNCKEGRYPESPDFPLPCSFMVVAAGGEPKQVCGRCTPRGFSSDGSLVLFQKYDKNSHNKDRIIALDLHSRTEQDFLSHPDSPLYQAYFSWDDRWVVFNKLQNWYTGEPRFQLMIAAVQSGDDKPQFSADGNTVYFTSTRDGYLCIWAQRLDPVTKHPLGLPFA